MKILLIPYKFNALVEKCQFYLRIFFAIVCVVSENLTCFIELVKFLEN